MTEGKKTALRIWGKALAFALLYAPLHFLHKWLPSALTAIPSGTGEAVFQHMKIGFWTWAVISLGERFLLERRTALKPFLGSRALGTMAAPALIFLGWYSLAGVAGPMPTALLEVLSAFAIVIASGAALACLELSLQAMEWKRGTFILVLAILALALFLFVRYADSRPWVDLFAEPLTAY